MIIMHIGLVFCKCSRHISRTQSFQQNRHILFLALVALKLLVYIAHKPTASVLQGLEKECGDFAETTAFERYGVNICKKPSQYA